MIMLPRQVPDRINTVVVVEFVGEPKIKPYPTEGRTVTVSSQKTEDPGGRILVDGDRQTRWEAAKGEHKATMQIDLGKPTSISTVLVDEPWHLWRIKSKISYFNICKAPSGRRHMKQLQTAPDIQERLSRLLRSYSG